MAMRLAGEVFENVEVPAFFLAAGYHL